MGRWQFWPIQNIAHLLFPSNLIVIFRDSNPSKFMFIRNMYDIPLIWYWFQHDSLSSSFIYLSPLAPRTPWQWLLSLADGWLAQLVTVQLAILHFGFIIPTIWEWFLHVFTQQKWPFLPSKSGNGSYLDLPDCNWMFVWIMRDSPVDRSYNQYLRCTSK